MILVEIPSREGCVDPSIPEENIPAYVTRRYFAVPPNEYVFPHDVNCRHCRNTLPVAGSTAEEVMHQGYRIVQRYPVHGVTCPDCAGTSRSVQA